jgi:hypothetical protein
VVATSLALASGAPAEYLDEETGATIAVVSQPLVFARERSGLGRDYITLAAAAVDQSGRISYVLVGYMWSVGSSPGAKDVRLAAAGVGLQADDRQVDLNLYDHSARELGIGVPVHPPPFGPATPYVYVIDLATLQLLAESRRLSICVRDQSPSLNYQLFEDGRNALKEFVRFVRVKYQTL